MKTQLSSGLHQTLLFMPVWSLIFGMLGPSVTCAGSLLGPEPDPSPARGIRAGHHHRGVHLNTPYLRLCICIPKCDRVAPRRRVRGLWPAQQSRKRDPGWEVRRGEEKHTEDALSKHDQRDAYGSTEAEPDALRSPDETRAQGKHVSPLWIRAYFRQ